MKPFSRRNREYQFLFSPEIKGIKTQDAVDMSGVGQFLFSPEIKGIKTRNGRACPPGFPEFLFSPEIKGIKTLGQQLVGILGLFLFSPEIKGIKTITSRTSHAPSGVSIQP